MVVGQWTGMSLLAPVLDWRDVDRSNFSLWWLRGQASHADMVWQALHDSPGFFGLLAGGADIAVRVTNEANLSAMQSKVQFKLDNAKLSFAVANPDARWWRLGPLTAAEVAEVTFLIAALGLKLDRETIRYKSANRTRTRTYAFFRATGNPLRASLDDGGWNSSEARLHPADPPPRRSPTLSGRTAPAPSAPVAAPSAHRQLQGPARTPQSTWAGPHRSPPPKSDRPKVSAPAPRSARTKSPPAAGDSSARNRSESRGGFLR